MNYSRGNNAFYNPKGLLSVYDFNLDENGYVKTGYDNAFPSEDRYICSQRSKKWFGIVEELDCFCIDRKAKITIRKKGYNKRCQGNRIWCIYGFRVVIEYYDTNVLLEVQNRLYDCGYERDEAINKMIEDLRRDNFDVSIVGDLGFINVMLKES